MCSRSWDARRRWRGCGRRARRRRRRPGETPPGASRRVGVERGAPLPGAHRCRALRAWPRAGRGAGARPSRLSGGRRVRQPVPPRAGDGGGGARRHRHAARHPRRAARAVAGRLGGLHRGRGTRPRGRSVSRLAAGAGRLSAARRRAARRGELARARRHGPHPCGAPERRGRAGGGARRRDQRVRVRAARLLVQLAVAAPRRQRLADRRAPAAPRVPQRHRAPAGRARYRHPRARLPRRRRARAVITVVLSLFGGIALLLYGIRLSGDSLQRAAGGRLRSLLTGMARHRLIAVASGAAVTAIIQSSAATTLMLIGFVSAGLMTFRQTLGIILGADIGTTFTVQLIAFKVTDYALLLVGLGFAITFVARRALKDVGQAILGLGL